MSELKKDVSGLKIERKKVGLSLEERLSIDKTIINLGEQITALINEKVQIREASAGSVYDHL